jgi:hypothetical protein
LRPLGLGEILDRAVTLCVRHFVVFALIWVVFVLPLVICQFLGTEDQSKIFGALADVLKSANSGKGSDSSTILSAMQGKPVFNGWTGAYFFMLFFVAPLPSGAMIAAAGALYRGERVDFSSAYRTGLARYFHLLAYNVMWIVSALILYVAVIFIAVIIGLAFAAFASTLKVVGVAIAVVLGIALFLLVVAFALVVSIAYEIGVFTCVLERRSFIDAFASGIQRVFGGIGLRRSLLVGLAFLAIVFGIWIVVGMGQAILYGLVRSHILGTAFSAVMSLVTAGFTTAFMTIFYFDLRVREEGLDLQLAAQAVSAAAPTP